MRGIIINKDSDIWGSRSESPLFEELSYRDRFWHITLIRRRLALQGFWIQGLEFRPPRGLLVVI